jgi:hypothetical protein
MPYKDPQALKQHGAAYYAENAERLKAYQRDWRLKNVDLVRQRDRARGRKVRPHGLTKNQTQQFKRYGITPAEYFSMLAVVPGCAICGRQNDGNKKLAIDHDHNTGRVRGLLCENCNNGLGRFKDSPDLLLKAAEYLR